MIYILTIGIIFVACAMSVVLYYFSIYFLEVPHPHVVLGSGWWN